MRKLLTILLILAVLPLTAHADADLAAMSTDALVQLREAVEQEIAARATTEAAQTVTVDGVSFRLLRCEIGQGRDDTPGLGIVLLANNPSAASMTPIYDLGVTVTQGGRPLEMSWVESATFTSSTVFDSDTSLIAPGAVDMPVGSKVEIKPINAPIIPMDIGTSWFAKTREKKT